jgi:hypothetical protein
MTTAGLRKKLQGYIDKIPERTLRALKPLLSVLADDPCSSEPANAAKEEKAATKEVLKKVRAARAQIQKETEKMTTEEQMAYINGMGKKIWDAGKKIPGKRRPHQ